MQALNESNERRQIMQALNESNEMMQTSHSIVERVKSDLKLQRYILVWQLPSKKLKSKFQQAIMLWDCPRTAQINLKWTGVLEPTT
jgi:hypothetical protein